jgi:asparagine synthase (glutamine-hydrolysing)
MCGFAGEFRTDGNEADLSAVARMTNRLRNRGPDGSGLRTLDGAALGHRRLAVIDPTDGSAQPLVRPDLSASIVFNGCIYNYRELRDDLRGAGYDFVTEGDTEVILVGYRHWGPAVVDHLVGAFAFAVVDELDGRLFLARDRLGVKPLYIEQRSGAIRFASTIPALLAGGGVDTAVDPVGLHHYLSFHGVVPAPRTILCGIQQLPAATTLAVDRSGAARSHRYWRAPTGFDPASDEWSDHDWADALEQRLRTAVQRRLVADVPVGCLLSGGVDSSLITALCVELHGGPIDTYSIGFTSRPGRDGDEFAHSDRVAAHLGTRHHRLRVGDDEVLEALDATITAMSEPMVSHDAVAFHLLGRFVSDDLKVVQSGQGADEVFGGYHWQIALHHEHPVHGNGADSYRERFVDRSDSAIRELVPGQLLPSQDVSAAFVESSFSEPAGSAVERCLRIDTEVMLIEDPVKRVDNMLMDSGVEARVPFLDHQVVELAGRCPPASKLGRDGKEVVRAVARRLVPAEVVDREKGYFPVPAMVQLDGAFADLTRAALCSETARRRGLFRPGAIDDLLADQNASFTPLGGNTVWQLAVLELWLQRHGIGP